MVLAKQYVIRPIQTTSKLLKHFTIPLIIESQNAKQGIHVNNVPTNGMVRSMFLMGKKIITFVQKYDAEIHNKIKINSFM